MLRNANVRLLTHRVRLDYCWVRELFKNLEIAFRKTLHDDILGHWIIFHLRVRVSERES